MITPEEQNNITQLSALCSITPIYIGACKKVIIDANTIILKRQYKYDTLSAPNRKVVDKRIKDAIKNLTLTLDTTSIVLGRIEKSMRSELSDEYVDALIDALSDALNEVKLENVLKKVNK
jgi:hypothetical protein